MKPIGKLLLVTLGFGAFGFAMSLVPQKTATGAGSAPVTIVNTPLSVEGTVGVNNFPATQAVTGTVAVSNFPAFQSPVAAEAFNSFDANGVCSFIGTDVGHNDFCFVDPIYTVPTGKIAVVEHASGRCVLDPGIGLREARVKIGPSGGLDNLPTQFSFLVPGPSADFLGVNSTSSFAQATKTYVAAGGAINFEVFATSNQVNAGFGIDSCELDISGYLVSR